MQDTLFILCFRTAACLTGSMLSRAPGYISQTTALLYHKVLEK